MAGELTFPVLAVPDLDEGLAFYGALGFRTTMQQRKPNPYAVVRLEDLQLHLSGVAGLDPENSLGNVIVVVPDPAGLYSAFAAGFRGRYGRIPATGAPRLLRPRKKQGTIAGFSVVDPGGNWLRIYGSTDAAKGEDVQAADGLAGKVDAAARLGDGKDDPRVALSILEKALAKFTDAPPTDRARALLYAAELAVRTGDAVRARTALDEALAVALDSAERVAIAAELRDTAELVEKLD